MTVLYSRAGDEMAAAGCSRGSRDGAGTEPAPREPQGTDQKSGFFQSFDFAIRSAGGFRREV
jgi:hypothetical protein